MISDFILSFKMIKMLKLFQNIFRNILTSFDRIINTMNNKASKL